MSPQQAVPDDKITLTFRHFWTREHDRPVERIIADVIREFEEAHPHIKIDFEGLDQTIHREQKLKSEMVTGRPPDIFSLFGGGEIEPYVRAERLMDLTEFIEQTEMDDEFSDLSLWTFDGRVYGLPFEGNSEPLFYNKRLFRELDLEPPATIDGMLELVPDLKQHGIIPFALGNDQQWPAAIYVHYLMDRQIGSDFFAEVVRGEESFNHEAYVQAMETFDKLIKLGAFPEMANQLSTEQAVHLFAHGQAAMYVNGNWDITLFQNEQAPPDFVDDVGVLPFPAKQREETGALAGGYTVGVGLSSALTGKKRTAALQFLEAMYNREVQERFMVEAYRIPAMSVKVDTVRMGPVFSQVIKLTEESGDKFVPYDNMLPPEIKQTFLQVIAAMLEQTITPQESLEELQRTAENYRRLR
ncbi:ABC transporter substrate-binding protein [Paenibacillus senegalensis]|uniref:ABC transporter substrate-binding protein n=1 Tax=Paenibacillus senegalensis TaxID=1465766 RepID=UPI0002881A90|nr:extracellular solute-binding protein [Paenibacillus senegalensis]